MIIILIITFSGCIPCQFLTSQFYRLSPPGKYKKYSITSDKKSLTITKLKPKLDEGCYIAVVDLGDYTLRALFKLDVKALPRKEQITFLYFF